MGGKGDADAGRLICAVAAVWRGCCVESLVCGEVCRWAGETGQWGGQWAGRLAWGGWLVGGWCVGRPVNGEADAGRLLWGGKCVERLV